MMVKILKTILQRKYILPQVFVIILVGVFLWKHFSSPVNLSNSSYSYFEALPTQLVLSCQAEGKSISNTAWAELIAIRSTLADEQQIHLIRQLKSGVSFEKLSWVFDSGKIPGDRVKLVQWRREKLLQSRYYEPGYFLFPVQGKTWYMDTFGSDREGGSRKHEGTDLFSSEGTALISAGCGKVERLGWNRLGGERVGIRGEDGNYYYYAHLQRINPQLKIGQHIEKGTPIGTVGHTGDALTTPDHLHFGIERSDGTWINPYPYLKVWQEQTQI